MPSNWKSPSYQGSRQKPEGTQDNIAVSAGVDKEGHPTSEAAATKTFHNY